MIDIPSFEKSCDKCSRHLDAISTVKEHSDESTCEIFLIGHYASADDDLLGVPFCDVSGQNLKRLVFKSGLANKVLYTYLVCCGTGKPSSSDASTCRSNLDAKIHAYRPRVLVALGDAVGAKLFGRVGTGKEKYLRKYSYLGIDAYLWLSEKKLLLGGNRLENETIEFLRGLCEQS